MKRKKNFFDEDIAIDMKLFDNFKLDNIVSWSHIELWCTIQNIEVDYTFFKGILCGAGVINKLYDVILDAVENTEFLDKFIDNPETIEIIEKLFVASYVSRTYKAKEFWIDIAYKQDYKGDYMRYFNSGIIEDIDKKYKLLNAIFKKNQFSAVKFYNKYKMALHHNDINFERWLLNSFKKFVNKSLLHFKVFKALEVEVKKQTKLAMYLN